jgi:hypothetical protein
MLLQAAKELSVQTILIPHEQRRKRVEVASSKLGNFTFHAHTLISHVMCKLPILSVLRRRPEKRLIPCRSPRSANSCDVLHPVCLPGLALVWRVRLLPVARCRSNVGPDEARPNSLSLHRIFPIESAHAIVEASNHGRIQCSDGVLLSSHQMDHCWVFGSKDRRATPR